MSEIRLIDANALLDFIHNGQGKAWFNSTSNRLTASDCVNAQPTVPAEVVRHGRWVGKHKSTCSECGDVNIRAFVGPVPMYCQICGARMDGQGEGGCQWTRQRLKL